MSARIEVDIKPELPDPRGNRIRNRIKEDLGLPVSSARVIEVYFIDKPLADHQLEKCRLELFTDPVTQHSSVGPLPGKSFDWMIEIGFLPGVTDNVGNTSREAVADLLKIPFSPEEAVYSARQILISGSLSREQVEELASLQYNPLIQRASIQNRAEWEEDPLDHKDYLPKVRLAANDRVESVSLNVDDETLTKLGREGILDRIEAGREIRRGPLALDIPTLKVICNHFNQLLNKCMAANIGHFKPDIFLGKHTGLVTGHEPHNYVLDFHGAHGIIIAQSRGVQ